MFASTELLTPHRALGATSRQPAIKQATAIGHLVFIYLLLEAALLLPYFRETLANLRWVAFTAVAGLWILQNSRWVLASRVDPNLQLLLFGGALLRVASICWSPFPMHTAMRSVSLLVLTIFLLGFCARVVAVRRVDVYATVVVVFAAAVFVPSIMALVLGWQTVPFSGLEVWKGVTNRFCGVLGNPNAIGTTASVCAPMLLAVWWHRRRLYLAALLALCLLCAWKSGSRAGMLGVLVGLSACVAVYYRVRWFPVVAIVVIATALLVWNLNDGARTAVFGFVTRDHSGAEGGFDLNAVAANRFGEWATGWTSIMRRPVFGQGYGVGGTGLATPWDHSYGYPLHNSFLQIWQENGVIALLLTVATVFLCVSKVANLFLSPERTRDPILWGGVAGVFVGGLTNSFFESWLVSVGNLGTLPFWAAAILLCSRDTTRT